MIKDRIADVIFQQILRRPAECDVLVMPNLNGDYMFDALTALVRQGLIGAIQQKNVTYDLARQMERAEEIICSAFGDCVTASV